MRFLKKLLRHKKMNQGVDVYAPSEGEVRMLTSLEDGIFSKGIVGSGLVIKSQDGQVYAPFSGEMISVYKTRHAFGIEHKNGLSVLIHIGLDTASLNGQGFTNHVKQGDFVEKGTLIASFDLNLLKKNHFRDEVIVVVPNELEAKISHLFSAKEITKKDKLFTISLNDN